MLFVDMAYSSNYGTEQDFSIPMTVEFTEESMSAAMCSHYGRFSQKSDNEGEDDEGSYRFGGESPIGVFTDPFVEATTDCRTFEQLLAEAPWEIDTLSDFFKIPCEDWDDYIDRRSEFGTWTEMLSAADVLRER